MKRRVIVDTGPIVAFVNGRDKYHHWAILQWADIEPPLLTCEPVLSEVCFLLRHLDGGQKALLELLNRRILHIPFGLVEYINPIGRLLQKYPDVPMSLADACLVRMSELYSDSPLLTSDPDFKIYRKNKRQVTQTLSPPDI
jgi:predicted nucleic acid-binding protein